MRATRTFRALVAASAVVGTACRHHAPEGSLSRGTCMGKASLEISNNTRTTVEIVEMTGTTRTVVAIVSPGVQLITIPASGTRYGARLVGDEAFIAWERSTRASPAIRFRRLCDVG